MNNLSLLSMLRDAKSEIVALRERNRVLEAKVSVLGADIVARLDSRIDDLAGKDTEPVYNDVWKLSEKSIG